MGQDPSTIRSEIAQTRERMGDTVEALAYKADVKSRAKDSVNEKVDSVKSRAKDSVNEKVDNVKSKFTGAKESVTGTVGGAAGSVNDATPSAGEVKQGARRAGGLAKENPLGLALGAVAVGFIGGLLVPTTRVEDEKIGPLADQVKDQVKETAQVAVQHGKDAAQDAAQAATQAAKDAGQQHAEEAKSDLQDQAQQAKQQVGSTV